MTNYEKIKEDLQKNMLITTVKVKLMEAKTLLLKANRNFNYAIKVGTGKELWVAAKNLYKCQDRYKMAVLLYHQVKKEGV